MMFNVLSVFGNVLKAVVSQSVVAAVDVAAQTAVTGSTSAASIQQNLVTVAKAAAANISVPDVINATLGTLVDHATITWTDAELAAAESDFIKLAAATGDIRLSDAFAAGAKWATSHATKSLVAGAAAATSAADATKQLAASLASAVGVSAPVASEVGAVVGTLVDGASHGGADGAMAALVSYGVERGAEAITDAVNAKVASVTLGANGAVTVDAPSVTLTGDVNVAPAQAIVQ